MSLNLIWLLLSLCFSPSVHCLDIYSTDTLDAFLQESAFKSLVRHRAHTGALYKALLPANLSGLQVSIVRIRSRTLWKFGANFSNFQIPSRTMALPHVRRLAIVYQDLGNWSSRYYSVPGYSMIAPVVGFMVFNASNARAKRIRKVSLDTNGKAIVIRFPNSTITESMVSSGAKCVAFSASGAFHLAEINQINECHSQDHGHFSIVVPQERRGKDRRKQSLWYLWVIGFALGFSVVAFLGYFGVVSLKLLKTKKIQVMERQADEDLVLETIWVGSSKMPYAAVTRTQPSLENGGF
ncbi:hypothetical protein SADUNF_Sadunf01G0074900 [Salix dunnii]|uniref:Uncharacterized protein n=1 Tax=Salix dunnii TaxID=1413687 RepID=A0A835NAK2_9ROSI|nr:hypothetical protein SADUNF_Sadunf01G0074900 [Salix dunnii]